MQPLCSNVMLSAVVFAAATQCVALTRTTMTTLHLGLFGSFGGAVQIASGAKRSRDQVRRNEISLWCGYTMHCVRQLTVYILHPLVSVRFHCGGFVNS
jgi:hypothetical protein